eukprot:gene7760-8571_t
MMAGSGRLQGLLASHSLTSTTTSSSSLRTITDTLQKKAEPVSDALSKVGDTVWRKRVLAEAQAMAGRLPMALRESLVTSSSSFLQSAVMLIPIGLLLNVQLIRSNVVEWLRKGAAVGVEWSKIGAVFVGGEILCQKLRACDDRLNVYVGSGLSSAVLRIEEGPFGMLQGFLVGYAFMYVIDKFFVETPQSMPTVESLVRSKQSAAVSARRKNFSAPTTRRPPPKLR